jgi:hypothetical protein
MDGMMKVSYTIERCQDMSGDRFVYVSRTQGDECLSCVQRDDGADGQVSEMKRQLDEYAQTVRVEAKKLSDMIDADVIGSFTKK